MKELRYHNVFASGKKLFTKGDDCGFGEMQGNFREFDSRRSKMSAAIARGISQTGLKEGDVVLYLGASHGYTPSFVSDIVKDGFVFAVDHAPRVLRDLVFLCEKRKNMCPIMEDANHVDELAKRVSQVDYIYQDIAQRNQTEIFIKNCKLFLKKGGFGFLALKARSVDVTKKPKEIFKIVRAELEKELTIVDYRELEPYQKDHAVFICKK